jgi:hypothetical protein
MQIIPRSFRFGIPAGTAPKSSCFRTRIFSYPETGEKEAAPFHTVPINKSGKRSEATPYSTVRRQRRCLLVYIA